MVSQLEWKIEVDDLYKFPTIELFSKKAIEIENHKDNILVALNNKIKYTQHKTTSIICFPYGGGNSLIYKDLSDSLNEIDDTISLYSIKIDRDQDENITYKLIENSAKLIVDEINKEIQGDIILYGHCVGSALTIETARLLEAVNRKPVAVYIGGSFPPGITKHFGKSFDPWRYYNDKIILNFLESIGMQDVGLDDDSIKPIMKAFRHDVKCYYSYFNHYFKYKRERLNTEIYNIVGDKDPLTYNYLSRYKNWYHFSNSVELIVIKNAKHYF
jgi:surfactin synthase thioesterase subunit